MPSVSMRRLAALVVGMWLWSPGLVIAAEDLTRSKPADMAAKPSETFKGTDGESYPSSLPPFPKTLEYLATEPVTLMDLGIQRLQNDLIMVGRELMTQGAFAQLPVTGAYFDFRRRKIIAYLTSRDPYGSPQAGFCTELFERVAKGLANRARGQRGNASWYLESLFSHEGWGNWARPSSLREDLMDLVKLEITILPPDLMTGVRVKCGGRFDADAEQIVVKAG